MPLTPELRADLLARCHASGYVFGVGKDGEPPEAAAVSVAFARLASALKLPGIVEIQEVRLGAKIAGRVGKVHVQEGDKVKVGDVLITIDAPELEEEYRRLMGDDILRRKLDALEAVEATASETEMSEEQVTAWLSAIHDLRLVLGTSLDVQEDLDFGEIDPTSPDAPTYALYEFLTVVEYQIVEALTASL